MCAPSTADVRTVLMSAVDEAAIKYLHELLSEPNQTLITAAMRRYQSDSKNRLTAFYDVLNARINRYTMFCRKNRKR